jgi:UPF0716 protein FxsA
VGIGLIIGFVLLVVGEIWVALQVAHHIGGLATIGFLVLISVSGPWLVRRQGAGVWRRATSRLSDGEVPGREAADGGLLLLAGVLLAFPGFITGALGALLLLSPVRRLVRAVSGAWLIRRVKVISDVSGMTRWSSRGSRGSRGSWSQLEDPTINAGSHDLPSGP